MSDRVVQTCFDYGEKSGQSIHSFQSVWMAHWSGASHNVTAQTHSLSAAGYKESDSGINQLQSKRGLEIVSNISSSPKGMRKFGTRNSEIINGGLRISSTDVKEESFGFHLCPAVSSSLQIGQQTMESQALRSQIDHNLQYGAETSYRKCYSQAEGTSHVPIKWAKTNNFLKNSDFSGSRPLQEDFSGSTSKIVSYKFDQRNYRPGDAVPLFLGRSFLPSSDTNLKTLGHEQYDHHSHASVFLCKQKLESQSNSCKFMAPHLTQNNASVQLKDPSTSKDLSLASNGEWFRRMLGCSSLGALPGQYNSSEDNESEKLHKGCYSLQKMQHSVHDVETMKICASVDSVLGLPGGCPNFSQTMHSLLITQKTDVNLCKENHFFRNSRPSAEINRNCSSDFHAPCPFSSIGNGGVKLQPLGSSIDTESRDDVHNAKPSEVKNESSAETDTMDMDALKEKNQISGENSSLSNKVFGMDSNLPLELSDAPSGDKVASGHFRTKLPGRSLQLSALQATTSSRDKAEPSTSRTQTLNMELLLAHDEPPGNSQPNICSGGPERSDPSIRWVKRLKLSASSSTALGTKSSDFCEALSQRQVNRFIGTSAWPRTTSNHRVVEPLGKETMTFSKTTTSVRNGESTYTDTELKAKELLLSHSWIKRWLHKRAVVVCTSQSSNLALEDLQKKQFPSIAAMALMGKAMNGFQPCEFQKRDSFVVWNNRSF